MAGRGVPQDRERATGLYRKACAGGESGACIKVGESYLERLRDLLR
jgi:TPR repeat protein